MAPCLNGAGAFYKWRTAIPKVAIVTPPSPPFADIDRQAAGGMGLWKPRNRRTVGHSEFAQYDLPLLSTAGVLLDQGHDVCFVDGQAERLDAESLACRVSATSPDFIVGMVQLVSLISDLSLLANTKHRCPGAQLIVVGSVVKVMTERILANPAVDYVVIGEPELPTSELIAALAGGQGVEPVTGIAWRNDGQIVRSTPRLHTDLASLPAMPYHLLSPYRYIDEFYFRGDKFGLVVSSRGCPYKCAYYCPYPLAYGKKILFRRPEVFVKEIEFLNREFGVRSFQFRDQVFTISEAHARKICQLIADANLDIRWLCETRFDLLRSDELLEDMRRAGCVQIHFGLETGDPALFEAIGKPGTTLEVAEDTVRRVRSKGMHVHVHAIVGLPGETWSTVRGTFEFIRRLNITKFSLNRCIPYPGTAMHDEAQRKGRIQTHDFSRYGSQFVMRTAEMSTRELELAIRYLGLNLDRDLNKGARPGRRARLTRLVLNPLVEKVLWRRGGAQTGRVALASGKH